MKRIISMLLIICMLFQIMPTTVFALENETSSPGINQGTICDADLFFGEDSVTFPIEYNAASSAVDSEVSVEFYENQISPFGLRSEQKEAVRYSILVLDTSDSSGFFDSYGEEFYTADTAINYVKTASKKFVSDIKKATGTNYVAIVEYKGSRANIVSEFSTDYDALSAKIDSLYASENIRSVSLGLETAYSLLEKITDKTAKKNVVLFTTGMTNEGDYTYSGRYNQSTVGSIWRRMDTQVRLYAYANAAINQADKIKENAMLYSVGLFQTMEDMPAQGADIVEFFKLFASDIAISSEYFYDVNDPKDLEFVFGEIADDVTSIGSKFNFAGQLEKNHDSSAEYFYTDEYFFKDPNIYNSSLSTMSLCLELSTWSSYDYDDWYNPKLTADDDAFWEDKLVNVKTLLLGSPDEDAVEDGYGGIGFKHFAANSFWENAPQKDSIGVVAARKQITDEFTGEDYTLVAVVVRGGGYGSEWASNVTVGDSGDHQGFAEARDNVLEFLCEEYLPHFEDDESKNIKLWIVGYSRAGATANMIAGAINEGYELPHNVSDVYCYAFEAPMGVLGSNISGTHKNIHNVINLNDVVPYVAPYKWGFERYNQDRDYNLPTAETTTDWMDAYDAMIDELEKLGYSESDYIVPETSIQQNLKIDKSKFLPGGEPLWWWENSEVSTKYILTDGVDFFADDVLKSRGYYVENLQHVMRQILGIVMHYYGTDAGLEDYAGEVFDFAQFMQNMSELFTMDNMVYILSPMFSLDPFYSYDERIEDVELRLMKKMGSIFREYAEISGFIDALAEILIDVILQVAADVWDNNTDSINLVSKFVDVLKEGVLNAHFPEVCLAWLRSQDTNYNKQFVADDVNSSITRIIRINCPVNINVYDENGVLVASIIDDVVVDNLGSIICLINSNGEKIVYLPGDGEYSIDVIATDDGYVSYAVDEFNYIYGTETRIENYYDVSIKAGDVLKALVPEIPREELSDNSADGSTVDYVLEDCNANSIAADGSYRGEKIKDIYYTVMLDKEGNSGYITGAGTFVEGRFAEVEAQVLPGGEFLGWYENGVLVSDEHTYRFSVRQDVTLTAKFTEIVFHELKLESTAGGTVSSTDGYYSEGVEVAIVAEPDAGYVFDHWTASNGGTFANPYNPSTTFNIPNNDTIVTAYFKEQVDVTKEFSDVYNDWYTPYVQYVYNHNLMLGIKGTDRFEPNSNITKAQVAQVLYNMENQPEVTVKKVFRELKDVYEAEWYANAVAWAYNTGVVTGDLNQMKFFPNADVTREQLALMMYRYAQYKEYDTSATSNYEGLVGGNKVANWSEAGVKWAVGAGLISGVEKNGVKDLAPQGNATRAQVAAILQRFCELYKGSSTKFTRTEYLISVGIPADAFTWNSHYYAIFDNCTSWEEAKIYCESRGGHLATISSEKENAALFDIMKKSGYDSAYFGFSDSSNEGNYSWVNNEEVRYVNWNALEPSGDENEDYAMFFYLYEDGTWNDGAFVENIYDGGNAYICEWDWGP